MQTAVNTSIILGDGPVTETRLEPFRADSPNFRQAAFYLGDHLALYAYEPEVLEHLADAMLKVAAEMRADRTAHRLREERREVPA